MGETDCEGNLILFWSCMFLWRPTRSSSEVNATQPCPTLCYPMDYGIFLARILEWIAFPFSTGSSQPRDWTQVSWTVGGLFTSWVTKGSPRILEWLAYPFSNGSSWPRNLTGFFCIVGRLFMNWAMREDLLELTTKNDALFIIGDRNAKVGSQEIPGVKGKFGLGFGLGLQNETRKRKKCFAKRMHWS